MPQLEGSLYLLLAGTVLRHLTHSRCGIFGALGLRLFGKHFGGIDDSQCIAHANVVALFHPDFEDAAGHFARHAIFRHFNLTLNLIGRAVEGEIADQGYDCHHSHESGDGEQNVVMLLFC